MKIHVSNIDVRMVEFRLKTAKGQRSQEAMKEKDPAMKGSQVLLKERVHIGPYKAYFAVDENNNVVIRVVDEKGRVIRQIPPEEYLKIKEALRASIRNLLNLEA